MSADTPFTPLDGGCRCEQVRFRIEAAPIITQCCHCRECQNVTGSAFAINTMIESRHVSTVAGHPVLFVSDDGQSSMQCAACGSNVWAFHRHFGDAVAFIGVGRLDEGERLPPEVHYFTRSRHPWVSTPANLPAFETLGDAGKAGARAHHGGACRKQPATRRQSPAEGGMT